MKSTIPSLSFKELNSNKKTVNVKRESLRTSVTRRYGSEQCHPRHRLRKDEMEEIKKSLNFFSMSVEVSKVANHNLNSLD